MKSYCLLLCQIRYCVHLLFRGLPICFRIFALIDVASVDCSVGLRGERTVAVDHSRVDRGMAPSTASNGLPHSIATAIDLRQRAEKCMKEEKYTEVHTL